MPKRSSIGKRRSKALPAFGFAGMSLSMASGVCASTNEASANTSPPSQKHEILLGEEEISDVSLATFYVFDREHARPLSRLFQKPPTGRNLRSLHRQRSRHSIERRSLRNARTKWRPPRAWRERTRERRQPSPCGILRTAEDRAAAGRRRALPSTRCAPL